jgi:hypothetical protein
MNRYLIFGSIILAILIIVFLVYKFKQYPDYLAVVPNESVTTKKRPKTYYKLIFSTINGVSSFSPSTMTPIVTIDKTNKKIDPPSGVTTGIPGTDKRLFIYNNSPDAFNIIGTTLVTTTSSTTVIDKIKMTIGPRSGDTTEYTGNKTSIKRENQIEFTNISNYILNKLTIVCDNVTSRSLYVYITSKNLYYGILINNLKNDILLIDLYNNP